MSAETTRPTPPPIRSRGQQALSSLIRIYLQVRATRHVIEGPETSLSGDEFSRLLQAVTASLAYEAATPRRFVALALPNSPTSVLLLFARLNAGAVPIPIPPMPDRTLIEHLLRHYPSLTVALPRKAPLAAGDVVVWGEASLRCRAVVDLPDLKVVLCSTQRPYAPTAVTGPRAVPDDLALVVCTSGSTGAPKGVMVSYDNLLFCSASIASYLDLRASDRIAVAAPFSFDYALYQIFLAVMCGGVLQVPRLGPTRDSLFSDIWKLAPTVVPLQPHLMERLLSDAVERPPLDGVRLITSTGGPFPQHCIPTIGRLFPRATIVSMYGLTECKRVAYLPPEEFVRRPASVGVPIPGTAVSLTPVSDETAAAFGVAHPADEHVGELHTHGPHVTLGYWEHPEHPSFYLDDHGRPSLRSGDLFRRDRSGFLYFVGRLDGQIKVKGIRTGRLLIETQVSAWPEIAEAAVACTPSASDAAELGLYIVLRTDFPAPTLAEVRRRLAPHVSAYMLPTFVVPVSELPRTSNGKIDYHRIDGKREVTSA